MQNNNHEIGAQVTLVLNAKRISYRLSCIVIGLVIAYFLGQFSALELGHSRVLGLVALFDLNKEGNVPALFSTMLLTYCSALLFVVAFGTRKYAHPYAWHWWWLGLIFLFLAIDENTALHERTGNLVTSMVASNNLLSFAPWMIPYALLVFAFAITYLRFLIRLPNPTKWQFACAGVLYVAGTMGLEAVGALHHLLLGKGVDWLYVLAIASEESLEMFALIFFSYAILGYIATRMPNVRIGIDAR